MLAALPPSPIVLSLDSHSLVSGDTACVSLHRSDTIRLVAPPSLSPEVLRHAIETSWPKSIHHETVAYGVQEFRLDGKPWSSRSYSSQRRALLLSIIRTLAEHRWRFLGGINSSKKLTAIDSLYFKRSAGAVSPAVFAMYMHGADCLHLAGEAATDRPESVRSALLEAVAQGWPAGGFRQGVEDGVFSIKLHDCPWGTTPSTAAVRLLLANVVRSLATVGCRVLGSCGVRYIITDDPNQQGRRVPVTDVWLFEIDGTLDQGVPPAVGLRGDVTAALPSAASARGLSQIATVTALGGDFIEVVSSPELGQSIVNLVRATWRSGIQRLGTVQRIPGAPCKPDQGAEVVTSMKLRGYIWNGDGDDSVGCRRLLLAIFTHMLHRGWRLAVAPEVCMDNFSTHTFIFERAPPMRSAQMVALAMADVGKLRLICSIDDMGSDFVYQASQAVGSAITTVPGTKGKVGRYSKAPEWGFAGMSWEPDREMTVWNRALVVNLIEYMRQAGFDLYTACRMTNKPLQCDTLVFLRQPHRQQQESSRN